MKFRDNLERILVCFRLPNTQPTLKIPKLWFCIHLHTTARKSRSGFRDNRSGFRNSRSCFWDISRQPIWFRDNQSAFRDYQSDIGTIHSSNQSGNTALSSWIADGSYQSHFRTGTLPTSRWQSERTPRLLTRGTQIQNLRFWESPGPWNMLKIKVFHFWKHSGHAIFSKTTKKFRFWSKFVFLSVFHDLKSSYLPRFRVSQKMKTLLSRLENDARIVYFLQKTRKIGSWTASV